MEISPSPIRPLSSTIHLRTLLSRTTRRLVRSPLWRRILAKLLPLWPAGSTGGTKTFGTPVQENFDEYAGRFDQVLRGQDHLFARVYINKYKHAPTFDGKNLLTAGPGSLVLAQNWAIGYTWVISPSMVNNTVVDFVRSNSDRGQQGGPGGTVPDMKTFGSAIYQLPTAQRRHPELRCLRRFHARQLHRCPFHPQHI